MHTRQLLLAGIISMMIGCVGGITTNDDEPPPGDDEPPTTGQAKAMFDRDVFPILTANCGAGCHLATSATSTPFVAASAADAWSLATGFNSVVGNFTEAGAPIWSKLVPGPHNARTFNTNQQTKISAWLAQELVDRAGVTTCADGSQPPCQGPGGETPGQATARLISEWSGCLNVEDFITTRFGESWANQGSDSGNCENCHSTGAYGMLATDDNTFMYEVLSTNKAYMGFFFQASVLTQPFAMKTNEGHFITLGLAQPPHQEHPEFEPTQANNGLGISPVENLTLLYDLTMARMAAGTCGPARIPL